jgi:hypothetical protein
MLIPVTMPVIPTVAAVGTEELHTPPLVPSVNAIEEPMQTIALPAIAAGAELMMIDFVATQPVGSV